LEVRLDGRRELPPSVLGDDARQKESGSKTEAAVSSPYASPRGGAWTLVQNTGVQAGAE